MLHAAQIDPGSSDAALLAQFDDAVASLRRARESVGRVVIGQDKVVDRVFTTLLAGGHGLLIGVPGLAKTLLVDTAAKVFGLNAGRIQCTPDLMPADIVGSEVLEEGENGRRAFRFVEGPVFTQFLMADEINRASPRTQSALLQAMQEGIVTVGGKHYPLPKPFHVLATQNPLEQEGTYPLPEAQLDRFLMQIDVPYPDAAAERAILLATTGTATATVEPIFDAEALRGVQTLVRAMPVGESVVAAILHLVRGARPGTEATPVVNDYVAWAPGPRAAQSLMLATRAAALIDGRSAPSVDDVIALAVPVLRHRMTLNYRARADGIDLEQVIGRLVDAL